MTKEKKDAAENSVESLENALTRTERYIESNQKSLTIIVLAIVIVVGAYLGYKKLYLAPMEEKAQSQIFAAEQYFERDSFKLALNGDGNYLGLLDIIDKYGPTKSANLAFYYAGVSYRELGDFETAIKYLKKFNAGDLLVTPLAYGAIGDCYVELKNYKEGVNFYEKAVNYNSNDFTTPIFLKKSGLVYEELKDYKSAQKVYEQINEKYPKTTEARDIEKDIIRIKALQNL
ncbi:MAG: tol-pal system YbgF family protein [Tenuifilaceae bacterium]